ncbi:type VII secretion protein EccB [Nocardia sp. NPDC051756]|uniref:type VII secretion protein EccB n=1 Tax=Nocardia sp. NPDC051756 TaxID=3154751 RepID=UPI003444C89A
MPAQLTTRAQVNGYRFLLQRYGHAMVRRDVRMLHDPMRIQFRSLITGIVLAVLVTAGCAILAFLRPQGQLGDAKIIMSSGSGALYVMVDGTLHPALNLASARLITGSSESPTSLKDSKLSALPRGPLLGIPGAPGSLADPVERDRSEWTLCEDATAGQGGTVLAGPPQLGAQIRPAAAGEAVLATRDGATYLIYDGKHARVDMGSDAIVSALHVRGLRPRPIGTGLLNATVAAPELVVPAIPNAGEPSAVRGANLVVGSVIRVQGVNGPTPYVVLADGVQKISEFTAQVLRASNSMGLTVIPLLSPDAISGMPVLETLPVGQFPAGDLTVVAADADPVACAAWARGSEDQAARLQLLVGRQLPLADGVTPVALVAGDGARTAYIPGGSGEFVQVTGIEPDSTRRDVLFYVTDTGVRFGIPDLATATVLGLTTPKLVPWQIISQLPGGPILDRQSALIARDVVRAGQ